MSYAVLWNLPTRMGMAECCHKLCTTLLQTPCPAKRFTVGELNGMIFENPERQPNSQSEYFVHGACKTKAMEKKVNVVHSGFSCFAHRSQAHFALCSATAGE